MTPPDTIKHLTIGVAGLGAMGLPMARRLVQAGFRVVGYDVVQDRDYRSVPILTDPGEFAEQADVLLSIVRDEPQNVELCFVGQAVFRQPKYPKVFVLCSTVSPGFIGELAAQLPKDVTLLDAPMSGAPVAAEEGSLTWMLGGDAVWLDALSPLFSAMGTPLHKLGALGSGMAVKVLNNYVAASSVVAVRRALVACPKLGVPPEVLLDVMSQSSGQTWFGNRFLEIDWARQDYSPENTIGILEKDVKSFLKGLGDEPTAADEALLQSLRKLPAFPE